MSDAAFDEFAERSARLTRETFLRSAETHAEIGSTSDRAIELCRRGRDEPPMLVLAERQTAGRGRGAARWWSGGGALTFSLILDPLAIAAPASRLSVVPLTMAAAVAEAVADAMGPPQPGAARAGAAPLWVKWPNDVYAGDRKLAGVLTESVAAAAGDRLVIGVGVNVNNRSRDAPAGLRGRVASVTDLRLVPLSDDERATLLVALLNGFADRIDRLAEGFAAPPCPLDGRRVRLETAAGPLRGEYVGVDDAGALLLRIGGRIERVVSGEGLRIDDHTS